MMSKKAPAFACVIVAIAMSSCSTQHDQQQQAQHSKHLFPTVKLPQMTWKYQQTPDKKVQLGRRGNAISIQTDGVHVSLDVPKGWKIVSCMDQQLIWHYAVSAPDGTFGFGMKVVRFPNNPSLQDRYANYLEGIHQVYDASVQMSPSQPFDIRGKKVPAYQYSSPGWGNRLVVMIPDGDICTVFEFYARVAGAFSTKAGHDYIQKILNTYSLRKA